MSKENCSMIWIRKELWKINKRVLSRGSELSWKSLNNLKRNKNSLWKVKCNKSNKSSLKVARSIFKSKRLIFLSKRKSTSYNSLKWRRRSTSLKISEMIPSPRFKRIPLPTSLTTLPLHSAIKLWQVLTRIHLLLLKVKPRQMLQRTAQVS